MVSEYCLYQQLSVTTDLIFYFLNQGKLKLQKLIHINYADMACHFLVFSYFNLLHSEVFHYNTHYFSEVPKLTDNCIFWLLAIMLNYEENNKERQHRNP